MALTLSESLREARSLPVFNGTNDYSLANFMNDNNTVLDLTPPEYEGVLQTVLTNRIQGKALQVCQTLVNPGYNVIIDKLREEFGIKRSFFNLRCDAMDVIASNLDDLHCKLNNILSQMNFKYHSQPDISYTPNLNGKIIFDIYINFLPLSIKSLLIQNQILSINDAYTYYLENNINTNDIKIINKNGQYKNDKITNKNVYSKHELNGNPNRISQMNKYNNKPFQNSNNDSYQNSHINKNLPFRNNRNSFPNNNNYNNPYYSNSYPNTCNIYPYQNNNNHTNNSHLSNNVNGIVSTQHLRNHEQPTNIGNQPAPIPMDIGNFESNNFVVQSDSLPILSLTINDKIIRCLIDSGAMTSLGDYKVFSEIGVRRKLTEPRELKTISGTKKIFEEVLVDVPSQFNENGQKMLLKLVDLQEKSFDCIIGVNILHRFGANIDFKNNMLTLNNCKIPLDNNIFYLKFDQIHTLTKSNWPIEANKLSNNLNNEEGKLLKSFLNKNKNTFYIDGQNLSHTNCVKHKIVTTSNVPIYCKNFRHPQSLEQEIDKQIDEMLQQNIIRHSKSPYNSPLWLVKKKSDISSEQRWRLVIDFRRLNEVTVDDKFPIPNIDSLFDKLGRAQYFTSLDLAKGFHQILMDDNDVEKTAFSTSRGHFEFLRMPFGLKNAPATFQRMMNYILSEFINIICVLYMDDILVFSTSLTEHFENLQKIFNRLNDYNLKIQIDKCKFLSKETTFLGHVITNGGIKPNPEKINIIKNLNLPKTVTEIKSFLGLSGYYRKFIKNYSNIASPIIKYLKKGAKIDINDTCYIEAFEKLKTILINPPILSYPNFNKKFVLTTDASNYAVGAVLSQEGKPICFASRTLNAHEQNYSTLEKELLAIVWSVKYFRPYLYGRKFLIQTDHQPLKWLHSLKEPNSRIIRWRILLDEFQFDIEYLSGKENRVADFLSRIKVFENSENPTEIEVVDTIVNKYKIQIRLMENIITNVKTLHKHFKVVFISKADCSNTHLINDILRREINTGKIGYYTELNDNINKDFETKLLELYLDKNIKFIKCLKLAVDVESEELLLNIIEDIHIKGNHRGIAENYNQLKDLYYFPNVSKYINKVLNNCRTCIENKYDRKPIKKQFNLTVTPDNPNDIVHLDIFQIQKTAFLTTIDKFTKMATAHKLSDKNMCTVKVKIEERIAFLGKPKMLVMDNEFNNTLIRIFCQENDIETHFTTPHSHTGNSDIERLHLTILEHIRILKNSESISDAEELVLKSIKFYNNTIHFTTKLKPIDFLNKPDINIQEVKERIEKAKLYSINKQNLKREKVNLDLRENNLYTKNPLAQRQKTAKRFVKYHYSNPNKVDFAQFKRPLKKIKTE